ncbi:hypothetical protein OQ968_13145 [Mycobacterium sp. 663a-19]|nr:hypothetical protein [Mycobacterium sp. 663a-19]MEB3982210.1 hypothetical protein [Mycobacterium sp. 663a-19]
MAFLTAYLTVAGVLVLVLSPVLLAATVTAVHAIRGTNRPAAA